MIEIVCQDEIDTDADHLALINIDEISYVRRIDPDDDLVCELVLKNGKTFIVESCFHDVKNQITKAGKVIVDRDY